MATLFFVWHNSLTQLKWFISQIGWGESDDKTKLHEDVLHHAITDAVNDTTCFLTNPQLARLASYKTFCAAGRGKNPCLGDSGKKIKTWRLQKIYFPAHRFRNVRQDCWCLVAERNHCCRSHQSWRMRYRFFHNLHWRLQILRLGHRSYRHSSSFGLKNWGIPNFRNPADFKYYH